MSLNQETTLYEKERNWWEAQVVKSHTLNILPHRLLEHLNVSFWELLEYDISMKLHD